MKLITTFAIVTVTMMIIGYVCMTHTNSRSGKLERRVKKTNKDGSSSSGATPVADGDVSVTPFGADSTKFYIFGDTGQVDNYFKDYVKRSDAASSVKTLEALDGGKYLNFETVASQLKTKFDQAVILGDFLYTENKKGGIDLSKVPDDDTLIHDPKFMRTLTYTAPGGTPVEVSSIFQTRLENSTKNLNTLLGTTYAGIAPFWLLENGNHSYDVDAVAERQLMSVDTSKVRIYKHSKVHISKHACFADLSFGDIACLNKSYKDCFKGALGMARYGRNEEQTRISLFKLVEAVLTLKLCKSRWRIIRTHAAPFNTEIDQHTLFNKINGKILCKLRKAIPDLKISDTEFKDISEILTSLDGSKDFDLTPEILASSSPGFRVVKGDKVENRLFECTKPTYPNNDTGKADELKEKATPIQFSVMDIIDKAAPHFYLGSHLHASQLLFAPKTPTSYKFNEFVQSKELPDKIVGCKEINNVKSYKFDPQMTYTLKDCPDTPTEDTIEIKKIPDYNIIFVIGNSGRFLDPFFDGKQSASHIVWQRINTPLGLAAQLMKDKKGVDEIVAADAKTAYGFAELTTYSNDSLVVEFKEFDQRKDPASIKTVLKITLNKDKDKTLPAYTSNNLDAANARVRRFKK